MSQNNVKMRMQYSADEIVRAKFVRTIRTIAGYETEAEEENRNYSPQQVYDRILAIRQAFDGDLKALVGDITLGKPRRQKQVNGNNVPVS